jgi:flagellar biosynthetic protein FliO
MKKFLKIIVFTYLLAGPHLFSLLHSQHENSSIEEDQAKSSVTLPPSPHPENAPANAHSPAFPFEDIKDEQTKPGEDRFISNFINMLTSLGLIIALIFIVSWILKRFLNTRIQQINTQSTIKIIERRALTPKTCIYLLEIEDKRIVIAESTNGVTTLSQYLNGFNEDVALSEQPTFGQVLKSKTDKETNPS